MPPRIQGKLLRALQEREIEVDGAHELFDHELIARPIDFRRRRDVGTSCSSSAYEDADCFLRELDCDGSGLGGCGSYHDLREPRLGEDTVCDDNDCTIGAGRHVYAADRRTHHQPTGVLSGSVSVNDDAIRRFKYPD
jgi:hypothetical protein